MKRILLLLLTVLLAFSLTACASSEASSQESTYEKDGFTVDTENGTITKGEDVYTFTVSETSSSKSINITYPNGATYYFTWNGNMGLGGWSDNYDPERYADGDTLCDLISFEPPEQERGSSGHPLFGLLFIALGLFSALSPHTAWYLEWGWRYKDAEPSDTALMMERIGGVFAVIVGVLVMFI